MQIQSAAGVTTYSHKEGETVLNFMLQKQSVQSVECVKPIMKTEQVYTSKGTRIFWFIFWLCFFWPMMILIYFFCGHRTETVFTPGQWNVTMKDGSRFILTGNEQAILNFVKSFEQSSFLSAGADLNADFLAGAK